jgi:hypothetical protein
MNLNYRNFLHIVFLTNFLIHMQSPNASRGPTLLSRDTSQVTTRNKEFKEHHHCYRHRTRVTQIYPLL